jgi:hypothetical protein
MSIMSVTYYQMKFLRSREEQKLLKPVGGLGPKSNYWKILLIITGLPRLQA